MPSVLSFGTFEFDVQSKELRKRGLRLKLQTKPAEVLSLLLRNAGKLVTQEQLRQELWAADTFVDFEHSLGVAIWKLRSILGDTAENPRFIETLPRRGYRFLAPVGEVRGEGPSTKKMIAVLPFEDLSKHADDYFADGLTEELITQLGRLNPQRLGVIARASAIRYKGSEKSVREIASELGAGYVASGAVRRVGNRVRINAQLVQAGDQSHLWSESYDRVAKDVIAVQVDVAEHVAKALQVELLPQQRALVERTRTNDLVAYEFYLQGRYHWSKRTTPAALTAIEYFEKAIAADPNYALSHTGLADCYSVIGFYGDLRPAEAFTKAKGYAQQALQIDDDLAEAHSSLAFCLLQYDWDVRAAEHEHLKAIQLNPNCAPAHHWYGITLTQVGRFSQALQSLRRALGLDPFSVAIQAHLGRLSYFSHDYERAFTDLRCAAELDAGFFPARYFMALTMLQLGQHADAVTEFESLARAAEHPIILSGLAYAYGKAGKRAAALQTIDQLIALKSKRRVPPYFIALAYAGLPRAHEAVQHLEDAYLERYCWLLYLKSEPAFDAIRSDSAFAGLVQRILPLDRAASAP